MIDTDGAADEVMKMIEKYCRSYPEKGLTQSLTELIDHIVANPLGAGTKKMQNGDFNIGHDHFELRRGTVRKNEQVASSGNVAYRTRVYYAVIPRVGEPPAIAIKEILHHNDADSKYRVRIGAN